MSTKELTTVVVGIPVRDDMSLFLQKRGVQREFPVQWEFPGGKLEKGETHCDCLQREIREETGLDAFDVHADYAVSAIYSPPIISVPIIIFGYLCKVRGIADCLEDQITCGWYAAQDMEYKLTPFTSVALEYYKYQALRTYPGPTPKPGDQVAYNLGCKCPRMDNLNGKGVPGREGARWYISSDCPMHGEDNIKC